MKVLKKSWSWIKILVIAIASLSIIPAIFGLGIYFLGDSHEEYQGLIDTTLTKGNNYEVDTQEPVTFYSQDYFSLKLNNTKEIVPGEETFDVSLLPNGWKHGFYYHHYDDLNNIEVVTGRTTIDMNGKLVRYADYHGDELNHAFSIFLNVWLFEIAFIAILIVFILVLLLTAALTGNL